MHTVTIHFKTSRLILGCFLVLSGMGWVALDSSHGQSLAVTKGVRTVVRTETSGVFATSAFSYPTINDNGDVAFQIFSPVGSIVTETSSPTNEVIAQVGGPAPGYVGKNFDSFEIRTPFSGNRDITAFYGITTPTGKPGIWVKEGTDPVRLLAGADQVASGTSPGVTFRTFGTPLTMSEAGQIALLAYLQGTGVNSTNDSGIWSQNAVGGSLNLVARAGQAAPGTTANFDNFFASPANNSSGDVAFVSRTTLPLRSYGMWSDVGGSGLTPKLLTGQPVNGLSSGITLSSLDTFISMNESGNVVASGRLDGSGYTITSGQVILAESSGSFRVAAQRTQVLTGLPSGQFLDGFSSVSISNTNDVTFVGFLGGTGVTSSNFRILATEIGGSLRIVARDGNQVPSLATGITYEAITANWEYRTNDQNLILFSSNLAGPGVNSDNDEAFFVELSPGVVATVAREGDTIEVAPGVFKTIRSMSTSRINSSYLNDRGEFTFTASFTDSTAGVFVVRVPEANPWMLIGTAIAVARLVRRRPVA